MTVPNTADADATPNNITKKVIFEYCPPFTDCISEINNIQIDNAKYLDAVMSMYNLMKDSDNYSKTSASLWQYYRDQSALTDASTIDNFPGKSASFKFKQKVTGQIMIPLKNLIHFWGTLEQPLLNSEINLILTWSANCFIVVETANNQVPTFTITDTKGYVPVVNLSTQDNVKLLQQLKSGFKRTINWNKYQSKVSVEAQNQYLDFQADPNFQRVQRLLVLSYESNAVRTSYTRYFLPAVEIKNYNVVISGQTFLMNQ